MAETTNAFLKKQQRTICRIRWFFFYNAVCIVRVQVPVARVEEPCAWRKFFFKYYYNKKMCKFARLKKDDGESKYFIFSPLFIYG